VSMRARVTLQVAPWKNLDPILGRKIDQRNSLDVRFKKPRCVEWKG